MDPVLILFLSLLTAHLLADFALQSDRDIALKEHPAIFTKHIATVTILSWLFAGDWTNWIIPLGIGGTHALLDWGKLTATRHGWNENRLFAWDQVGHVAVIFALTVLHAFLEGYSNALQETFGEIYATILVVISGLVVTVRVGGLVIAKAIASVLEQVATERASSRSADGNGAAREGVKQGGWILGQLERVLIFVFVMVGAPLGVVFLLIAKAIFCFGKLANATRKEADYILMGTLMSFGWGLTIAWFTHYLLRQL